LINKIENFPYYIVIVGFEKAKIKNVEKLFKEIQTKTKDAIIQLFDANSIAGKEHLYFATLNALTAFKNKTNISNNPAIEILLYASAHRQIVNALKKIGIKPETREIAAAIVTEKPEQINQMIELLSKLLSAQRNDMVVELTEKKIKKIKDLFEISELEFQTEVEMNSSKVEALKDLVIEHIALLATQR
jgi:tRNA threonylcarbamoyladenosine modification (KEOPS) complex Cgi121 subunit